MTIQEIIISVGTISFSINIFFLREMYLMLKKSISDVSEIKAKIAVLDTEVNHIKDRINEMA